MMEKRNQRTLGTTPRTPEVSIIIVSWNASDLLAECLESIRIQKADIAVTVVDNASTDGSVEMVQARFPEVDVVANAVNVGFARANNQCLGEVRGRTVLLLNPDTRLREGAITKMLTFLEAHGDCGALGPKIIQPQGRLRVLSAGRQPSVRTLFNHFFFLSRWSRRRPRLEGLNLIMGIHDDHPRQVEWLTGACLLIRREVIERVGGLNEQWVMYADDLELCSRIAMAGWELWHVPEALVEHHMGVSHDQNPALSALTWRSLRDHFIQMSRPTRPTLLVFDAILAAGIAIRAVGYSILSMVDWRRRRLWRREARLFAYAARPWRWRH